MEDNSYCTVGKPEETYDGIKLYGSMRYFKDKDTFVETFMGEDGEEYSRTVPRHLWDDQTRKLAKEKGIL